MYFDCDLPKQLPLFSTKGTWGSCLFLSIRNKTFHLENVKAAVLDHWKVLSDFFLSWETFRKQTFTINQFQLWQITALFHCGQRQKKILVPKFLIASSNCYLGSEHMLPYMGFSPDKLGYTGQRTCRKCFLSPSSFLNEYFNLIFLSFIIIFFLSVTNMIYRASKLFIFCLHDLVS